MIPFSIRQISQEKPPQPNQIATKRTETLTFSLSGGPSEMGPNRKATNRPHQPTPNTAEVSVKARACEEKQLNNHIFRKSIRAIM